MLEPPPQESGPAHGKDAPEQFCLTGREKTSWLIELKTSDSCCGQPVSRNQIRKIIKKRLAEETGTLRCRGHIRVALVYPSPYHVGMSSLGFQTIYRVINTESEHSAERSFLHDSGLGDSPLLAYESLDPVGDFDVLAFSLACELEVLGVIECLERAGLRPLAADRGSSDPIVVIGGPITFSNPLPAAPFADLVVMGEGESIIATLLDTIASTNTRDALGDKLAALPGIYVPPIHQEAPPPLLKSPDELLPAFSQITTPNTELSNMHLVEVGRGCHRTCSFCVMRHTTNDGMRVVAPERVLANIPPSAQRVGLVGAAVTDHPDVLEIAAQIVSSQRAVSVSSLRADRLSADLVSVLASGGYKTLTVASDGASERLRRNMKKSIKERHLRHAAELVVQFKLRVLKVYMMLGVPDERDEDIDELIRFTKELAGISPLALAIGPFVAKKNTPLSNQRFAGIGVINRRLRRLRKSLSRTVDLRSTSAKWAWVEFCLAQGGFEMGRAALAAHSAGAGFVAWKRAIEEYAPRFLEDL